MEASLKQVLDAIEAQKLQISEQFTAYGQKLEGFDQAVIGLNARIAELESQGKARLVSLPGVNEQKESFSFFRAINAIIHKDWSEAGFEKEVFDQTRKRASDMAAGTGTLGGYIVPEQYVAEIIEMLLANLVTKALGITIMGGLTASPIDIPKQTGGATAYWVAENAAITKSNLTFGQITMTPHQVGALVVMSNRLLRLSLPSAEAMVRRDIAFALATAVDTAVLRGTGTNNEPVGIANTSDINTVTLGTGNGDVPTMDTWSDISYEVEADNALRGSLKYAFHPTIKKYFQQRKVDAYTSQTTNQQYLIGPFSDAKFAEWIGYPFEKTTNIPINLEVGTSSNCTEIYFGNWTEAILAQWGGIEIMASNQTSDAFEKVQTWVRIIQEVDVAVRHPQSFCLCNTAKISS